MLGKWNELRNGRRESVFGNRKMYKFRGSAIMKSNGCKNVSASERSRSILPNA